MIRNSILTVILTLALAAPALAQQPVWATPADQIAVVSTGTSNGLPFAIVRDAGMRGHNVYCVTAGAHFGKLTVARISSDGILLSNGRLVPAESTTAVAPAAATAAAASFASSNNP
jgi:hypothetical protein